MKCQTCQQDKTATINGRMFCENCGKQAAERLRKFQSSHQPPEPTEPKYHSQNTSSYVLDLSNQFEDSHSQEHKAQIGSDIKLGGDITGPQQTKVFNQPKPETDQKNYSQSYTPSKPAKNISQPTTMEPHQTYTLKSAETETENNHSQTLNYEAEDNHKSPATDLDRIMDQGSNKQSKTANKSFLARLKQGKLVQIGALSLSMLLLAGYTTYLNYPNIAVRVAANNAEIDAQLPGYTPNGYSFQGPVAYGPGKLVISFGSEDGYIDIAQSSTDWDSQGLLDNYVRQQTPRYETYREGGLTIYTYGNGNAAWVNRGIFYKIESEAELQKDEVVRIASSM